MAKHRHALLDLATLAILLMAWGLFLFRLNEIPSGLQHDQTFNILDAIDVLYGRHQIYFPSNFGHEALFIYTIAASLKAFGLHWVWSARFSSVVWATVGLAAAIVLSRRYLDRRAALVAAFLVAGSFWLIFTARVGLRAVSALALLTLAIYLLARGMDRNSWRLLALAGLPTGAAMYTYLSARAFLLLAPILMAYEGIWWAARLIKQRTAGIDQRVAVGDSETNASDEQSHAGTVVLGLALSWLLMLAVSLPLWLYLRANPMDTDRRLNELNAPITALLKGDFGPAVQAIWDTLQALLWADLQGVAYQYSVPGRPALPLVWAIFFVLGLAITLPRALRQRREFLLIIALLLGLAPALLSPGGPLYLRAIVALPLIALLTARGAWSLGTVALSGANHPRARFRRSAGVALALVALSAWYLVDNLNAYFSTWATAVETQMIYNADLRAAADLLNKVSPDQPAYVSTDFWLDLDQQTYLFYEPRNHDVTWFYGPQGLPLPGADGGRYVWTASAPANADIWGVLAAVSSAEDGVSSSDGCCALLTTMQISSADAVKALQRLDLQPLAAPISYDDTLRLLAVSAKTRQDQVAILTQWETRATWRRSLPPKMAAVLTDETGYVWSQSDDALAVAFQQWREGGQFLQATNLVLPADIPPGNYRVLLRIYDEAEGNLTIAQNGRPLTTEPSVASVAIDSFQATQPTPLPPQPVAQATTSGLLEMLGVWDQPTRLQTGVPIDLRVSWRATHSLDASDVRFRLEATDTATGAVLWEQAATPSQPLPSAWPAGQAWRLTHRLIPESPIASDVQASLRLCAQLHEQDLACGVVAQAELSNRPLLSSLPASPQFSLETRWNDQVELVGHDLVLDGDNATLTLYWHTLTAPSRPLVRFVHAVDAQDQIVVQADGVPGDASVPMTLWRPGEYIVDRVTLRGPQDAETLQRLYVGLYDPATGQRVAAQNIDGVDLVDQRLVIPLER